MAWIAPALLAADFARLGDALQVVEDAGGRMLHLDVADGHFAGEITLGLPVVESIRKATKLELAVHLLIDRPERFVVDFVRAGANRVAVHPDSTSHLFGVLELIHRSAAKAGVALDPGTPLEQADEVFEELDFLTILGADPQFTPGKSGIRAACGFAPQALRKLKQALRLRAERGLAVELEVEGGVGLEDFDELLSAGADILVGDFAIFETSDAVSKLSALIRRADRSARPRPPAGQPIKEDLPRGT
jgi:ribulose-phosphate 3-epimerase